nr:coiled-coil domain-containing protein 82-like [Pocillopora verrucosa]
MASKVLQYSAETPSIMDPIDLKNKMNDSILNSEEITDDEAMEDVTPCSSAKKKAVSRKKMFGSQDEEYDKKYSDSEDDDLSDTTSCKDGEENAVAKKKRKASTSSVDNEDNITPLKQPKTEREQKVKRKLALGQLVHNRKNQQKGILSKNVDAADSSTKESEFSDSDSRSSRDESDLDGFVVEDSQSQDLVNGLLENDEGSEDEADLKDFVVDEDSEGQNLVNSTVPAFTMASHLLLDEDQKFGMLVESLLRSIVDASHEGDDDDFKRAQTHWERLINTKKESQVGSDAWRDYKEMLMNCPVVKIIPLTQTLKGKCEACLLPRSLTQCMVCYEEPDGEVKKEFQVGCFCAERGSLYHELHHYKQHLKESCSEKINKVRREAGIQAPEEIVKKCLDDEKWLDLLFSNFQSTLNAADRWAVDGDKALAMKNYCKSFVS